MAPAGDQPDESDSPDSRAEEIPSRRVTPSEGAPDVPFSPRILFGILADTRERYVLYYLDEHDGVGTLTDMADQLAAMENHTTVELTTREARNRVKSGLYHADLPKLDDYGFITFQPETGKVKATDQLDRIEPQLEIAQRAEPSEYDRFCTLLEEDT